ncbi:MAG: hypothetical protein LBD22_00790 [Spirochaetaceae bacterium]|jgi:uncharacterized protein YnzC (UPF0291/DUF896 family)|nr:hypothetical protein [Spirochaetaceae bacterium]
MSEEQRREYKRFIQNAWAQAVNHKKGINDIPKNSFTILLDSNGYTHTTNVERIKHIYDRHGNFVAEKQQGQIAITEKDFMSIPDIVQTPSFEIRKIKHFSTYSVLYGKHTEEGHTYIYIEHISKKKRRYLSVTFFKKRKKTFVKDVIKILENNAIYDISEIEIIDQSGGDGHPSSDSEQNATNAAATSANPNSSIPLTGGGVS